MDIDKDFQVISLNGCIVIATLSTIKSLRTSKIGHCERVIVKVQTSMISCRHRSWISGCLTKNRNIQSKVVLVDSVPAKNRSMMHWKIMPSDGKKVREIKIIKTLFKRLLILQQYHLVEIA